MGLVCDLNSIMAQIPPLFNDNQQLDEPEIVDYLANRVPRSHRSMMILKGLNPETGYLATFVKHYKRVETIDNIAMAKFYASDKDKDNKKKKRSKNTKECKDNS